MLKTKVLDTFTFRDRLIYLKNYHVDRTFEAYQLNFPYVNRTQIESIYDTLESSLRLDVNSKQLVRLLFNGDDQCSFSYEINFLKDHKLPMSLELIDTLKNPSGRGPQNFKWVERDHWMALMSARRWSSDDILAQNVRGQITEASRFNIFIYDSKNNIVITPTLESGCINGVYRRFALNQKTIDLGDLGKKNLIEKDILATELLSNPNNYKLFLANSVRGVLSACLNLKNRPPMN